MGFLRTVLAHGFQYLIERKIPLSLLAGGSVAARFWLAPEAVTGVAFELLSQFLAAARGTAREARVVPANCARVPGRRAVSWRSAS